MGLYDRGALAGSVGSRARVEDAAAAGSARGVQRHRHRRRVGRPQRGHPAEACRHPVHRHREERRSRRYVVREPVSRLSRRYAEPVIHEPLRRRLQLPEPVLPGVPSTSATSIGSPTRTRYATTSSSTPRCARSRGTRTRREWQVSIDGPDGERVLRANGVITAVGFLNRPKLPEIEGMLDLPGTVLPLGALAERP